MRIWLAAISLLCAGMATAQESSEEIRMSIYFGGGSYTISEDQASALYHWLDSIPDILERYDIHLISHTDPIGGRAYNEWLSRMRSQAVFALLLRKPVPEYKISVKDWGLENAVYSNETYNGMRLNRRVDVILYPIIF